MKGDVIAKEHPFMGLFSLLLLLPAFNSYGEAALTHGERSQYPDGRLPRGTRTNLWAELYYF